MLDECKSMTEYNFKAGNELWKLRKQPGKRKFETTQQLFEALCDYFQWVEDNPIQEEIIGWYQGEATHEIVTHPRAMTCAGACLHMGIAQCTWQEWRTQRPEYAEVMDWAYDVMFEQKFTHAAAGQMNATIIARDLGLVDKQERSGSMTVTLNGDDAKL